MYFDIYCWKDKVSMHGYIFEISPKYLNVIIQINQGHLCLWREGALKEKYNTKYFKINFYLIFRVCK